jgi:hypothetical protein
MNNIPVIGLIASILWLVFQYFKNKYFMSQAKVETSKEQVVNTQIAKESQTIQTAEQAEKAAVDAYEAAKTADTTNTSK